MGLLCSCTTLLDRLGLRGKQKSELDELENDRDLEGGQGKDEGDSLLESPTAVSSLAGDVSSGTDDIVDLIEQQEE